MNRSQRRSKKKKAKQPIKKVRVAIGIPTTGITPSIFSMYMFNMGHELGQKMGNLIEPVLIDKMVQPLSRSRNELVMHAHDYRCDLMWFLDSDMITPWQMLPRLLSHQKDIVGCNYPRRNSDLSPNAMALDGEKLKPATTGVIEVIRLPTGCLLINMNVFAKLSYPWFKFELEENEFTKIHPFKLKKGEYWEHFTTLSEDYYFCDKARDHGYKIFCDTDYSNSIGHIGQEVFHF